MVLLTISFITMKSTLLFFAAIIVAAVLVIAIFNRPTAQKQEPLISPIATSGGFSLEQAPSKSLKGTISFTGSLEWQSRIATMPALLTQPVSLQQGEIIITKDTGRATIEFPNAVSISASPNTEIEFIQTLPDNFVVLQRQGKADYKKSGTTPLSLRILGMILKQNEGEISASIDDTGSLLTISVIKGSITAAYNDVDYLSNVLTVSEGETLTFDNETKTATIN